MNRILLIFVLLPSVVSAQRSIVTELNGKWKFTIGDREEYKDPNYDDSSWEAISVNTPWENEGFANYNGYAWYRYSFDGSSLESYENLRIDLGYIDDVNETYLNGNLIGFKGSFPPDFYTAYDALNEYALPEAILNRNGENVIAIKVYDVYKDGGMVKGRPVIYFKADKFINFYSLEGVWKFTTQRAGEWRDADYDDSDWQNIVVPSHWRSKYIKRSAGFGWYRKEFTVPTQLKDKDIYLVLGKIDDFDYTYVNGKLIGRTKDYLPMGQSTSWSQLRVYKIPKELLNPDGKNLISVVVEDIGVDAGIYDGPVGITERVESN